MARFDQGSAECLVFTSKEGLLSPIAHDLKIRASRFSIDADEDAPSVRMEIEAGSLEVVSAMRGGREHPALSDQDKREIEENIRDEVLHAKRHAVIRFESTKASRRGDGFDIEGDLTLHGVTRRVRTEARAEGDLLVAELRIHQPDFGIKPYKAALGTLRVSAEVKVRVSLPLAEL